MRAIELAELAQSWDLSERVVGIAALNALSQLAIRTNGDDIIKKYGDVVDLIKNKKRGHDSHDREYASKRGET